MLYQLSYEATHWERGQFIEFMSPMRSEMTWSIYEIIHIWTVAVDESEEWSSQLIFQFKQLERKSLKKSGLQRDSNLTHDLRDTGAMICSTNWAMKPHGIGSEVNLLFHIYFTSFHSSREIWTQQIDLAPNVWLHSSVGRASPRYRGGHRFESRWSLDFFRLLLSNCLNWKINCHDHSSLSEQLLLELPFSCCDLNEIF